MMSTIQSPHITFKTTYTNLWKQYYLQFKFISRFDGPLAASNSNARLRQGIRIDRHLHSTLPFLLPLVHDDPVLIWRQRLGVWQLHGADQIFTEQLGGRLRRAAVIDALEVI